MIVDDIIMQLHNGFRRPDHIVISNDLYDELEKEVKDMCVFPNTNEDSKIEICGYPVYRSDDIEGFKVGFHA